MYVSTVLRTCPVSQKCIVSQCQLLYWIRLFFTQIPELVLDHILKLFDQSVDVGLDFLKQHSSELSCPIPGISAVKTLCCILDGLLRSIAEYHGGFVEAGKSDTTEKAEDESTNQLQSQTLAGIYIPTKYQNPIISSRTRTAQQSVRNDLPYHRRKPGSLCDIISNLFVFAFVWAFGGCFERTELEVDLDIAGGDLTGEIASQKIARGGESALEKFDALVYDLFSEGEVRVQLPTSARMIYQYYPNIYTNSFETFDMLISSPVQNMSYLSPIVDSPLLPQRFMFKLFINPQEEAYSASKVSMIPTVDIIRLSFLISVMFESNSMPNIMVSGKSGVGKTQLLTFLSKSVVHKKWRKYVIQSVLGKLLQPGGDDGEEDPRKDPDDSTFSAMFYHVSSRLGSQRLQSMLGSHLMRQGRKILLPPTGKNVSLCYIWLFWYV